MQIVARILGEELQCYDLALTPDTEIPEIEGWDSVTGSCVMIAIENEFGFEFDGGVLDEVTTAGKLVELIEHNRTIAARAP